MSTVYRTDPMMDVLEGARTALPQLLNEDISTWNSMRITYEFPHVRRLWKQFGEYRLYLHILEEIPREARVVGARPYRHKHPWPSAVMVLSGRYRMGINKGGSENEFILDAGSSYSMEDPSDEHYVEPLDWQVLSLMVTGKPYSSERSPAIPKQGELTMDEKQYMIHAFKTLLFLRPRIGLE